MAFAKDPQLMEVQKLCRDFSEKRFKEADRDSDAKLTAASERFVHQNYVVYILICECEEPIVRSNRSREVDSGEIVAGEIEETAAAPRNAQAD
jgi:hypothetical protein